MTTTTGDDIDNVEAGSATSGRAGRGRHTVR